MNARKVRLAKMLRLTGALRVCRAMAERRDSTRIVNYHEIEPSDRANFERQLRYFAARFRPVAEDEVGRPAPASDPRPGLLLTFDDGWDCFFDIAPMLERFGFRGVFFVPVGYVAEPDAAWLRGDPRRAWLRPLSFAQLRDLRRRGHGVGTHTWTHRPLSDRLADAELRREVIHAKEVLENELGEPVDSFAWVRGGLADYSRAARDLLVEAGHRRLYQTTPGVASAATPPTQLPRTNIEARFDDALVRFQLDGPQDWLSRRRGAAINRVTAAYA